MKILNLYAGIGGNRKLWSGDISVTAVERDPDIAKIYQDFFPQDTVIVTDAHQYLLDHYDEFEFIWSSPPCPTHSQLRFNLGFKAERIYEKVKAEYPEMSLYQEIILLKHWFKGKFVVENTIPYYEPLIEGRIVGGHILWANFFIPKLDTGNRNHREGTVTSLQQRKGFDIEHFDITEKRKILRNCVEPELGLHIFESAFKEQQKQLNAGETK